MKKKFLIIAAISGLVLSAAFSGCGNKEEEKSTASANATEENTKEEEVEDTEITTEELLSALEYDVEEYVELNEYKNMTIQLDKSYEVTEEQIQEYVKNLVSMYPAYEASDKEEVEDGDIVNIDYVGKLDGEAFDGGTAEGAHLTIGSGKFIDGFESGLIGVKVGDTVDLDLTFPEAYGNAELAGKSVVFTVTVNSIDQKAEITYETLTDEYVAANFAGRNITTVEGLIDQIKVEIEASNETSKKSEIQTKVLEKLTEECQVTYPEGLVEDQVEEYKEQIKKSADQVGVSLEEYMETYLQATEEDIKEDMEKMLAQKMILDAIVKAEGITIKNSEFEQFITGYITYQGVESKEALFENMGGEANVKLNYAENIAMSQVMNGVTVE